MTDLAFDFGDHTVLDISRFGPTGEPRAPIQQQGSLRSRHASAVGAAAVQPHVASQMARVYAAYEQHGALCDTEVEIHTGIDRSSVIPRRRALEKLGLVREVGFRTNPRSGKSNIAYTIVGG